MQNNLGFRPAPLPHIAMLHPVLWHGVLHVVCKKCRNKILVTAEDPRRITATEITRACSEHLQKMGAPHNPDDVHRQMLAVVKQVKKMLDGKPDDETLKQSSLGAFENESP